MNSNEINWSEPVKLVARKGVPEQYHQFDHDSEMAIKAALCACRPLLVRGEPGVGKTQLAHAAARKLKRPIVQTVVDSRTESRDLMWTFDPVRRLADAQLEATIASVVHGAKVDSPGESQDSDYVREEIRKNLDFSRYVQPGPLWWAFDWKDAENQVKRSDGQSETVLEGTDPAHGVVLLIDEIDKADPDVPNGLLEALGASQFQPFGRKEPVTAQGEPPLVLITTNEERTLPDAFIRRCLVLNIKLPSLPDELEKLLADRGRIHFPDVPTDSLLFTKAAKMVVQDRETAKKRNQKPLPGQAEYLDLLRAVIHMTSTDKKLTKKEMAQIEEKRENLLWEIQKYTLQKSESLSDGQK